MKTRSIPTSLALALVLSMAANLFGQSEHPISGRRIAPVMGVSGADWLERSEREIEEMPEAALDAIGIKPGMVVADVGAGVGYMTLRLAKRVGPSGKVYAEDIQPEMITMLRERMQKANLHNIKPVLGLEADPKLPPGSCDVILMVDVYHELSRPQEMLSRIRTALKPDGRLVLLEYKKEDPAIPIRSEHKMSIGEAKSEVEHEGFKLDTNVKELPRQHVLVFHKNVM